MIEEVYVYFYFYLFYVWKRIGWIYFETKYTKSSQACNFFLFVQILQSKPGKTLYTTYGDISWASTFFCWKWQNWDFAIAITFYPVIRTLWNFLCILFGSCSTQILNFNAKIFFSKMLEIVRKSGFDPIFGDFRTIFNIFEKKKFALKFKIWVLQQPNNMHKNFHWFLIAG